MIIEDMARKPAALAATSTLEGQEPHPVVSLEGALVIGSAGARVGILEFGDYECPYCARLAEESLPRLKAEYVSKGLVKYAFMNFPLESIHPYAREAAEAALCADEQGKFWNMHERLFTARGRLDKVAVAVMAEEMTLDPSRFRECVSSTRPSERVRMHQSVGRAHSVQSTPTTLVGFLGPQLTLKVVYRLSGARPFDELRARIEQMLNAVRPEGVSP